MDRTGRAASQAAAPNAQESVMIGIGVWGPGRVGTAIARSVAALGSNSGYRMVGVSPRDIGGRCPLARDLDVPTMTPAELVTTADLTVLAAPDDALAEAATALAAQVIASGHSAADRSVVHCSGALDLSVLASVGALGAAIGAWHPLQAFPTTGSPVRPGITWAVTASPELAATLTELSLALGGRPFTLAASAKGAYHTAASMAANYLVTLTWHATTLLESCGLTRDDALAALLPLLESTVAGLAGAGLPQGLTGPLARGDMATVESHLRVLADRPDTDALYRAAAAATLPVLAARGVGADQLARWQALLDGA
ncbi:MAG: DUF2520 domain-containing protein [Austwickia sp.]|nr:DUF2520 domain-containing protein [Austwickia sp.]